MGWTPVALIRDMLDAWSADNWPYTLGFWVIVGGIMLLVTRKRKPPNSN